MKSWNSYVEYIYQEMSIKFFILYILSYYLLILIYITMRQFLYLSSMYHPPSPDPRCGSHVQNMLLSAVVVKLHRTTGRIFRIRTEKNNPVFTMRKRKKRQNVACSQFPDQRPPVAEPEMTQKAETLGGEFLGGGGGTKHLASIQSISQQVWFYRKRHLNKNTNR